jgi:hypothetical protein
MKTSSKIQQIISERIKRNLNEYVEDSFIAYHGSPNEFSKFTDEFVGGTDANDQEGSGIYFTTSEKNAAVYGGHIYKVELSGRFLSRQHPKDKVDVETLVSLIKMQDGWEGDAQNWAEDPEAGAYEAAHSAYEYNNDEAEIFQQIEADFYRDTSVKYVRNMTSLGYDGIITTAPRDYVDHNHIIVFNPNAIRFIEKTTRPELNESEQSISKNQITDEIKQYVQKFDTDEALLRSGGIPIDMLDRAAHGFSEEDVKTISPKLLKVRWHDDLDNVKWEIKNSGLSEVEWSKNIDLSEPIDVWYMEGEGLERGFYIEDGHHRYTAAKALNKTLNCNVEIRINPISELSGLGYDEFHRDLFRKYKSDPVQEMIGKIVSESVSNDVWYHGTPDARALESQGGFDQRYIVVSYMENPDERERLQLKMNAAKESGDEDEYFRLLDIAGTMRKEVSMKSPVFLTNKHQVAKTYADPRRAMDYQNAEEKVVQVKVDPKKNIKIVATGDRFRFINSGKVKKGFLDAGVSSEEFDKVFEMFNFYSRDKSGIKTDMIAAMAQHFGFDSIDVVGVLDSREGGRVQSTVRMVFDPSNIKLQNLNEGYSDVSMDYILNQVPKLDTYPTSWEKKTFDSFVLIYEPYNGRYGSYDITGKIRAFDSEDGTEIGNVSFMPQHGKLVGSIDVRPDKRRQKVGTEMYKFAEEITGDTMTPDTPHSDLASKFWNQSDRKFGN